jgi:hypothetical protein
MAGREAQGKRPAASIKLRPATTDDREPATFRCSTVKHVRNTQSIHFMKVTNIENSSARTAFAFYVHYCSKPGPVLLNTQGGQKRFSKLPPLLQLKPQPFTHIKQYFRREHGHSIQHMQAQQQQLGRPRTLAVALQ